MLPRQKKTIRTLIFISLFVIILIVAFFKIDRDIRPVLFAVSNTEAKILATESINRIVKDELSKNVKYSDFVSIKTDKNGDISAIDINTVEMNKFGTKVALRVQEELKSAGERGVSIPIGVVTGSTILSHYGPRIKVKVSPLGYIACDFKTELQSAGINQTRYMVSIRINANLQIMIPLGKEQMNVVSTIPVAETLIVGKVPSSYYNSSTDTEGHTNIIPVPIPEK